MPISVNIVMRHIAMLTPTCRPMLMPVWTSKLNWAAVPGSSCTAATRSSSEQDLRSIVVKSLLNAADVCAGVSAVVSIDRSVDLLLVSCIW